MEDNPYRAPIESSGVSPIPMPHSGLGVASFSVALAILLFECAIMAVVTILNYGGEDSPYSEELGLGMVTAGFIGSVPIGLGLAALRQRQGRKLFAVLGIAIGTSIIVAMMLLTALVFFYDF